MKFLIDMNLTPQWVSIFQKRGFEAIHWSSIGAMDAADQKIMEYALQNGYIVFTHDLDFGDILAATSGKGPSVIQARTNDTSPAYLGSLLFKAIERFQEKLNRGALITLIPGRMKVRILPLTRS